MKHGKTSNCICVGVDFSLSSGLREEICQNVVSKMPDLLYARKIREAGSEASVVLRQPGGGQLHCSSADFFCEDGVPQ